MTKLLSIVAILTIFTSTSAFGFELEDGKIKIDYNKIAINVLRSDLWHNGLQLRSSGQSFDYIKLHKSKITPSEELIDSLLRERLFL